VVLKYCTSFVSILTHSGRLWQVALADVAFFFGQAVGSLVMGLISDVWGRKLAWMITVVS
jgi:MFS family permease